MRGLQADFTLAFGFTFAFDFALTLALAAMVCLRRCEFEVCAAPQARYILMVAHAAPMPLFDGAIQFLGCDTSVSMES
jgi:hypothetical protein